MYKPAVLSVVFVAASCMGDQRAQPYRPDHSHCESLRATTSQVTQADTIASKVYLAPSDSDGGVITCGPGITEGVDYALVNGDAFLLTCRISLDQIPLGETAAIVMNVVSFSPLDAEVLEQGWIGTPCSGLSGDELPAGPFESASTEELRFSFINVDDEECDATYLIRTDSPVYPDCDGMRIHFERGVSSQ